MNRNKFVKKGQEEMVGFVLIVVIVVIIAVIFLGISIRNSSNIQKESIEVANLLSAANSFTSDCQIPRSVYRDINELTIDCYNNKLCSDGKNSCNVLENTLKEMLNNSFVVGEGSYTKYYHLKINVNSTGNDLIQPIINGPVAENCLAGKLSNQKTISTGSQSDKIIISFSLCNNEM